MSFIKAKKHLEKFNLQNRVITFSESTATVTKAAIALGVMDGEIAKSMGFIVHGKPVLVITAGDKKIDNSKFKAFFNQKAKMISFDTVEDLISHKAGGVCPFGINEEVSVYLDQSLKQYEYVYPACGDANSAVKLTLKELETASNYISWIDVCKE